MKAFLIAAIVLAAAISGGKILAAQIRISTATVSAVKTHTQQLQTAMSYAEGPRSK